MGPCGDGVPHRVRELRSAGLRCGWLLRGRDDGRELGDPLGQFCERIAARYELKDLPRRTVLVAVAR